MKKKTLSIVFVLSITLFMSGCLQSEDKLSNNSDENNNLNNNNWIKNNETEENHKEDKNSSNTDKINLMEKIKKEGVEGRNIYCDNIKLGDNISDVEKIYGTYSESNYVENAKGIYYNYSNKNFAFGCNKGDQIFEIRSYDENLKSLSISDVESYFGKADYENKTTIGEKVIGYKISKNYKLLLVFDNNILDHYSVFYPEITSNLMADDQGRQW